ncbi:MAG: transposase [Actinomycetota bacterium]|nr:transposase [Actinomycetota bacterium]
MIVIGIDPHMKTHTAVALEAATGQALREKTVGCHERGREALLAWARGLGPDRYFAIEDCRHVSGRLERFLLSRSERVVPPKMMAGARSSARTYGKSDPIDAACVARAALREPDLPEAHLAGPERDARLLADHRDDLVSERGRVQKRLRWNVHDLDIDARAAAEGTRPLCVAGPARRRLVLAAADHALSYRLGADETLP